jgi:hypothetical protein
METLWSKVLKMVGRIYLSVRPDPSTSPPAWKAGDYAQDERNFYIPLVLSVASVTSEVEGQERTGYGFLAPAHPP